MTSAPFATDDRLMTEEQHHLPLRKRTAETLFGQRILTLDSALDDDIGTQLCSQLVMLSDDDPAADIALWINSPGGSVPAMLAITDVMALIPNDVITVNLGMAYSAGQFILCNGTRGKRFIAPHAKVLLHQGSAGIGGYAPDIELQADDLRHVRDTVLTIIAEQTGQTCERIFDDSLRDHVFTATECVEYGFVDHIVTDIAQIRPRSAAAAGFEVSNA